MKVETLHRRDTVVIAWLQPRVAAGNVVECHSTCHVSCSDRLRAQEVAVRDAKQEAELLQSKLSRQAAAREAEVANATAEVRNYAE